MEEPDSNMLAFADSLRRFDRFGYEIEMHFNGSNSYKTMWGACVTIVLYTLIVINFFSVASDFVYNKNQAEINRRVNIDVQ